MNKTKIISYCQTLPWNEIRLKANAHLPKLVLLILIILLTQTFATLTWELIHPEEEIASQESNKPIIPLEAPINIPLQDVSTFHLFGNAKNQALPQQKVINAPETRLRLSLKGVFASSNPKQAMAIIAASKGADKTYRIGDKITGGALLHAVYEDRIILKRSGKLETLRLPKSNLDSKAISTTPASIKGPLSLNRNSVNAVTASQGTFEHPYHPQKMRDTLLKDPAKIWQQVRINPVMKNGEIRGYTLAHNDPELMKALDLRKTDIVTAVNGKPLRDPAGFYSLMAALPKQTSLELSVERNGHNQTIQLSF